MNTCDAAAQFLRAKTVKGLSSATLATYAYRLAIFAHLQPKLPRTPEAIEDFLRTRGPSQDTRESYFRLLRNLYRWLQKRHKIIENPVDMVEVPKLNRKIARALSHQELQHLFACHAHSMKTRAFLLLLSKPRQSGLL